MKRIQTVADVYPAFEQLIAELKEVDHQRLATTIHHRLHLVAWTTQSELFEELDKVLSSALESDEALFPQTLRKQMEEILHFIGKSST